MHIILNIKQINIILFLPFFALLSCTINNGTREKKDSNKSEIGINNGEFNSQKDYQEFPEYQLAVKCPAVLKDVSGQSNDSFDFNYAGSTNDAFYQIMIVKIPVEYRNYQDSYKSVLKDMFEKQGGGETILFGDENLPAYLLNDYTHEGYKGRGIAVMRGIYVYTFNVMTNSDLDAKFRGFTNSISFQKELESSNSIESSDQGLYMIGKTFVVNKKVFFHNQPDARTIRRAYLYIGDEATVLNVKNGFGYIEFENTQGQISKGWIDLSDVSFVEKFQNIENNSGIKTYKKNGLNAYAISYPENWILKEKPNESIDISINSPLLDINVNVIVSYNNASLESICQKGKEQSVMYIPEYRQLSEEYITLDGETCIHSIARANMQGNDITSSIYMAKKSDNTLYTITLVVESNKYEWYKSTLEQIIVSFRFL